MLNNDSIKNRTIFCHDNLEILRGIDSDCVDLIYLDPPFNKKKIFTAPIGSNAEGASFSDIFREEDVKDEWLLDIKEDNYFIHNLLSTVKVIEGRASYNFCYLAYMAIRLIECQRVLKSTGSIYLHCDPTMSHYLKLLLDCIFGEKNFRNEIIWCYTGPGIANRAFKRKHDIILFYAKSELTDFNPIRVSHKRQSVSVGASSYAAGSRTLEQAKQAEAEAIERGKAIEDWWSDIGSGSHISKNERQGYPTQKPLALLERIIAASCPKGGIVLDPFCGCATTCVAAEKLERQWVGVDVSIKAYDLVRTRLRKEVEWEGSLFEEDLVDPRTSPPVRTDLGADTRVQKYVYIISNKNFDKPEEPDKKEWKVGIASNLKSRLSSYQTSDPNRGYVLEYSFLTPHFREIEKYILGKYENRHEWVREPDMQKIIDDIENYKP
ncbi:MAG: DNA methyltransferase [Candidatus Halichondribacter symbioticus]